MKRFIRYPSIDQFRTVIKTVKHQAAYQGLDENGDAVYQRDVVKPVITFHGTVKLHGTNAGVAYNKEDGIWAQSRKNIISVEQDNAGFAFFVESHKDAFQAIFDQVALREALDCTTQNIVIFGEWCGGNIQKGVSIAGLDKIVCDLWREDCSV